MNGKRALIAVAACLGLALAAQVAAAQTYDMKIGFASVNDPQDVAARRLIAELDEKSGGRIKGRTFPSAQLGGVPRMIEGVQLGTQEIWTGPPGFLVGLNPAFQAPDAPGLFDDAEHAHRSLTDPAFRERYVRLGEDKGVTLVSIFVYDQTWIASHEPIRRLADLKGKKLRVIASRMETELVAALGATGVPMDFAEVLPGLQTKTIDGVRSSIIVLGAVKAFSVVKNITFEGSGVIPVAFVASKVWLDKLPADLRKLVLETAVKYDRIATDIATEFRGQAEKLWQDNGATVLRLPPEDRRELAERLAPLGDRVLGENPRVKEVYDLLKASAAKNRRG